MTDFIDFEVSVEDNNKNEGKDDEVSDSDLDSLKSLQMIMMKLKMTEHFIKSLKT